MGQGSQWRLFLARTRARDPAPADGVRVSALPLLPLSTGSEQAMTLRPGSPPPLGLGLSLLPSASGVMLSTSLNRAAAAVGAQALNALRVTAASAAAQPMASIAFPATALGMSHERLIDFDARFVASLSHPSPAPEGGALSGPPPEIAGLALAFSPELVFRIARKRISFYFKLNAGICFVLASLGLIGIGGGLCAALVFEKFQWAVVLGGLGIGSWVGLFVFKSLDRIRDALNATIALEFLVLRLQQQLETCC